MFNKPNFKKIYKIVTDTNFSNIERYSFTPTTWRVCIPEIPALEEIAEIAINRIKNNGFSVERVSPRKSNYILRAFRSTNIVYKNKQYYMHGTEMYEKTLRGVLSKDNIPINYSTFEIDIIFCQDERITVEPHFVDYFLKIC